MGLFRRKVEAKAALVDDQRWALVARVLEPGEERRHNTPCRISFDDRVADAYCFVTDRSLLWVYDYDLIVPFVDGVPFHAIRHLRPSGSSFMLGFDARDGAKLSVDFELYPSPLSQALYADLLAGVTAAQGEGGPDA